MDTTRVSLLIRIRDPNNQTAWREFDAIYRPMLYRFARKKGLERGEAEEVTQQSLVAISQHITKFEYDPDKGRFKAWLATVLNNNIRKIHRRRRPQQALTADFNVAQDREETPDDLFERLWRDEHLRYCLDQVRREVEPSTYEAFRLYVFEERPVEEICEQLGMNANQIYKIKYRLTQKLEERMRIVTDGEA